MQNTSRYQQSRRVTLIGALTNALLALFKIIFGIVGHSQALLADGVHSLSDLLTDFLVLFAAKAASHGPDQDHPYGHGRFETMVTVGLALLLTLVGLGFIWEAAHNILRHDYGTLPSAAVLVVAIVSIVANELLFRYTFQVGKVIRSNMLIANAWHHRSDALSSIVVLIGALGTMLGLHFFDALAAIIVALMIISMAVKMAWQSMRELVDTGVDAAKQAEIIDVIKQTPGVQSVHQLRSRSIASEIFLDAHVQVSSRISVSEGHFIGDQVQKHLRASFEDVVDTTIHIDPEDDEMACPSAYLPSRDELEALLNECCRELSGWPQVKNIRLDYLNGKVYIEIFMPADVLNHHAASAVKKQYQQAIAHKDFIGEVSICFI